MADPVREAALVPGCPEHVALWDAINAYSAACGGHPTRGGGARMDAVVRVEAALRAALAATDGAIPTASRGGANDAEAGRRVRNTPDVARAIGSLVDAWDLSDEDSAVEKLRGPMNALRKLIDDDALYAVPLPPASAGEVETARIVGWAMCFVPFGHDDTAAKPKLIFDSKEHAEDVARRQTAFGIGEGARFVVRPITWAAERAATSGDHPSAARRGHEGEARGGAS